MDQNRILLALTEAFCFIRKPDLHEADRALWLHAKNCVDALGPTLSQGGDATRLLRVLVSACGRLEGGSDAQGCAAEMAVVLKVDLFGRRAA